MKLGEKQEKTVSPVISKVALDSNKLGRLLTSELELNTDVQILGSIYKQLLIAERLDIDDKISMYDQLKKERDNEKTRNDEIIRALTGRKPKKEKKEEVVEKKKPTKEEPKKEAPAKEKAKEPQKVPKEVSTKKPAPPKLPKKAAPKSPEKIPPAIIVAGAATGLLVGKEALAANISKFESRGDYNAYNKGTSGNKIIPADKPIDFSKMTITEYLRRGKLPTNDPDKIFAVGKYQIIPKTMEGLVKKLKIDPDTTVLDKTTQDSLFANGLIKNTRKKVEDYITGKSDDRDGAILQLAQEFASVGIPYDMKVGSKQLKRGDSYYSGVGGNKAHNPPEDVGAALDIDRMKNLKTSNAVVSEQSINLGSRIDQSSKENKELKKSLDKNGNTTIVNNQVNSPVITGGSQSSSGSAPDDRSAIQKKANK